mgnify:CR=1 FL=1
MKIIQRISFTPYYFNNRFFIVVATYVLYHV